LGNRFAAPAGELRPYVPDDLEGRGHVFQKLGDILAQRPCGKGPRAGFCFSPAGIAACSTGCSASPSRKSSSKSSSWSIARSSFSDERPNCMRFNLASCAFSRSISSACSRTSALSTVMLSGSQDESLLMGTSMTRCLVRTDAHNCRESTRRN
jgi:hypothetical protein